MRVSIHILTHLLGVSAVLFLSGISISGVAHAQQPADEPAGQDSSSLTPPKLTSFVEAPYPERARERGVSGTVVLKLLVDTDGSVIEAEAVEGPGYGLNEAAKWAARQFEFSPALKNGEPVRARLLYRYTFEAPPETDEPEEPSTGQLAGQVSMSDGETPAVGVEVEVTGPDGLELTRRTDENGRFEAAELPAGAYNVDAQATGIGEASTSTRVLDEKTSYVRLVLQEEDDAPTIDVTVKGESDAERMRQSANAVNVVETEQAQKQTADMGEVLARSEGVGVRRSGGLGSSARFSLNGLTGDKVRFFLDGIPLEFAGYPFGVANVPVNLIERVDIYRGVVPIEFGADALGGAVNLITDRDIDATNASASYQAGSFGTHRATLTAQHLHRPSGIYARLSGFFDYSDNDYSVDVEVPDHRGRLSDATINRFHDAYRSTGGNLNIGIVDQPWADRLNVRLFVTDFANELQHDIAMTQAYGDVEYGELSAGGTVRYEDDIIDDVALDAKVGYARSSFWFLDVGECIYNWFGQCVRERPRAGETNARPHDQIRWEDSGFGRVDVEWSMTPRHEMRLSVGPTYTSQTGDERRELDPETRDPLTARRDLFSLVTGVAYEATLFGERLENILFVKNYVQSARSEEPLPGGAFRDRNRNTHRFGAGDALRYRFTDWFYAKTSYEWATRLPRTDEVFGNGVRVVGNLTLQPETSHNVNLGGTIDTDKTPSGAWRVDVNGFLRDAEQLIVLLGRDRVLRYENVFGARSMGVEAAAGWTSPGEYVALQANGTYVDLRNTSSQGTFAEFDGDRIPNRPWLFANTSARLQLPDVAADDDDLSLSWATRYVHEFFRGWESIGDPDFKQVVDSQLLHSIALTYSVRGDPATLSFTGEVQNLTDEPAFDLFGVQRPGRAFYFKTTGTF